MIHETSPGHRVVRDDDDESTLELKTNLARKTLNHSLLLSVGVICSPASAKNRSEIRAILIFFVFFLRNVVKGAWM
jgi:hypothetical protein